MSDMGVGLGVYMSNDMLYNFFYSRLTTIDKCGAFMSHFSIRFITSTLVFTIQAAHAQQIPPENSRPQSRVIEEVLVTANKTEQSVQDIPGSVQALTGEFLQKTNVNDFADVSSYIPNLMVTETDFSPQIAIRGMQSTGTGDNSVGLVLDDLVLSQADFFHMGFFDLERIECTP